MTPEQQEDVYAGRLDYVHGEWVRKEPRITVIKCSAPCCTEGEHKWDGPAVMRGRMGSASCSKCGVLAFDVDTFMGGY